MKIGIISDSHDRIDNLKKAITLFQVKGLGIAIHCGDLCAPFMIDELAKFQGKTHCIFGNIDDRFNTPKKAEEYPNIIFHGDLAEIEIDGKKIAVNHFPKLSRALASTQDYDAVFYGHTHEAKREKIGKTLLVNPGELMGRKGNISMAIYDTNSNDIEIIELQ